MHLLQLGGGVHTQSSGAAPQPGFLSYQVGDGDACPPRTGSGHLGSKWSRVTQCLNNCKALPLFANLFCRVFCVGVSLQRDSAKHSTPSRFRFINSSVLSRFTRFWHLQTHLQFTMQKSKRKKQTAEMKGDMSAE